MMMTDLEKWIVVGNNNTYKYPLDIRSYNIGRIPHSKSNRLMLNFST